jgi:methanogenic corrinoid protein MtbC1
VRDTEPFGEKIIWEVECHVKNPGNCGCHEDGKAKIVSGLVEEALNEGCDPVEILNVGMIGAMSVVGEKFKNNEILCARDVGCRPRHEKRDGSSRAASGRRQLSKSRQFVIGTVEGDLHDIGKNLVAMMVGSAGFEVIDLGVDVPAENLSRR